MDHLRRGFLLSICGFLASPALAVAQQARRLVRIGWLGVREERGGAPASVALEGLRAGLRERGWIEGDNLSIEQRNGNFSNAAELASQLLESNVELIVAEGGMIFRILAVAGSKPLLFHINGDPVEAKLVASYARPGGNRTGVTNLSDSLSRKRVELLKEALPGMTRVAAIANQGHPGWRVEEGATKDAARQLGLELTWLPVYAGADFAGAFEAVAQSGAQGLVAVPDNLMLSQAKAIADFSAKQGIPAISGLAQFTEAGNLMSYGPALRETYVKLALYADKLLRGAKPADLPVENPTRFELVLNLRAAKAFKLRIPQSLRLRADRVIE